MSQEESQAAGNSVSPEAPHDTRAQGSSDHLEQCPDRVSSDKQPQSPATLVDTVSTASRLSTSTGQPGEHGPGDASDSQHEWRPFWLRRLALTLLAAAFALQAIGTVSLWAYSHTHHGVVEADRDRYFLWKFGPTAAFTVVAAFWTRIELQTMKYTPWMLLLYAKTAAERERIMLIDYLSIMPPVAFVRSFRAGHLPVTIVLAVSLLTKLAIVLSTGLITLEPVIVSREVVFETSGALYEPEGRSFSFDELLSHTRDTRPYWIPYAIENFGIDQPLGLQPDFAYEKFTRPDLGTSDRNARAVVESYTPHVECFEATSWNRAPEVVEFIEGPASASDVIRFVFDDCPGGVYFDSGASVEGVVTKTPREQGSLVGQHNVTAWQYTSTFVRDTLQSSDDCNLIERFADSGLLVYSATYEEVQPNISESVIGHAGALLCSSMIRKGQVEVTQNSTSVSVQPVDGPTEETLLLSFDLSLWFATDQEIAKIERFDLRTRDAFLPNDTSPPLPQVWLLAEAILEDESITPEILSSLDFATMERMFSKVVEHAGPSIIHFFTRSNETSTVQGLVESSHDKLVVNAAIAAILTGLSVLFLSFSVYLAVWVSPRFTFESHDTGMPLGLALSMAKQGEAESKHDDVSADEPQGLFSLGPHRTTTSLRDDRLVVTDTELEPLTSKIRVPVTIAFMLSLIALSALLGVSKRQNGFVDIDPSMTSPSAHLLWTSFPALLLIGITIYSVASNGAARSHALSSKPTAKPLSSKALNCDWIDMFGPRVLWGSVRWKYPDLFVWEVAALLAGLITIVASTLFTVVTVPKASVFELSIPSHKSINLSRWNASDVREQEELVGRSFGSLLHAASESSFRFPQDTYEDLLFPSVEIDAGRRLDSQEFYVEALLPTLKLEPACRKIPRDTYRWTTFVPEDAWDADVYPANYSAWGVHFFHDIPCGGNDSFVYEMWLTLNSTVTGDPAEIVLLAEQEYFGLWLPSKTVLEDNSCDASKLETFRATSESGRWFWGKWNHDEKSFDYSTMWECDYGWVSADADVTLVGSDLRIDTDNVPRIRESTASTPERDIYVPRIFSHGSLRTSQAFPWRLPVLALEDMPREMTTIIQPVGPVPIEHLGMEEHEEAVLDALNKNIGIVAVQVASVVYQDNSTAATVAATLVEPQRRRLVQNEVPTYILIVIISFVTLVNAWAILSRVLRSRGCGKRLPEKWVRFATIDQDFAGLSSRRHRSVAATVALWENSNVFEHVPADAHKFPTKAIHRHLEGKTFRLGWFIYRGREVYSFMVMEDPDVVFTGESRLQRKKLGTPDVESVEVREEKESEVVTETKSLDSSEVENASGEGERNETGDEGRREHAQE